MQVLAAKIERLGDDIGEMKDGITQLAAAVTKLAVVEERQTHMILAQERAFKSLERVEQRQAEHEKSCRQQERDLRDLVGATTDRLVVRIEELEKAEPLQAQTSKWTLTAIWAALGFMIAFVANRVMAVAFQ